MKFFGFNKYEKTAPSNNTISVETDSKLVSIKIVNQIGEVVKKNLIANIPQDISNLSAGLYFVII